MKKMRHENHVEDILKEKYHRPEILKAAHELLLQDNLSEETFLGAQAVLLLNGLI